MRRGYLGRMLRGRVRPAPGRRSLRDTQTRSGEPGPSANPGRWAGALLAGDRRQKEAGEGAGPGWRAASKVRGGGRARDGGVRSRAGGGPRPLCSHVGCSAAGTGQMASPVPPGAWTPGRGPAGSRTPASLCKSAGPGPPRSAFPAPTRTPRCASAESEPDDGPVNGWAAERGPGGQVGVQPGRGGRRGQGRDGLSSSREGWW